MNITQCCNSVGCLANLSVTIFLSLKHVFSGSHTVKALHCGVTTTEGTTSVQKWKMTKQTTRRNGGLRNVKDDLWPINEKLIYLSPTPALISVTHLKIHSLYKSKAKVDCKFPQFSHSNSLCPTKTIIFVQINKLLLPKLNIF